ncbi:MAG: hypothetical protein AB9834_04390 [Lentimicrobium sp.]
MRTRQIIFSPFLVMVLTITLFASEVQAQIASCEVILINDMQVSPNQVEFDIYLKSTNNAGFPDGFLYGNGQYRIEFDSSFCQSENCKFEAKIIEGSSGLTNSEQHPVKCSFINSSLKSLLVHARFPVRPEIASKISPEGNGTRIARIRLSILDSKSDKPLKFAAGATPDFKLSSVNPVPTAVSFLEKAGTAAVCSPLTTSNDQLKNKPFSN